MNDEKILDILIEHMIYSEKMRTVMCLSACFGLWDKLKPIVSVCYKI